MFERARAELLDQSAELSAVAAPAWEVRLQAALWTAAADRIFDQIYLPAAANAHLDVGEWFLSGCRCGGELVTVVKLGCGW